MGRLSAVVGFNRGPEMMTTASRLLLWIVCEHYFDDFNTTEI